MSRFALLGALASAGALSLMPGTLRAAANALFQIDQANSTLHVTITSSGVSDDDTQNLLGTINSTFDFGNGGTLPTTANLTTNSSVITSAADFQFGLPRFFPIYRITAAGLVADVTTPNPPGKMTKTAGSTYQFDASQFLITMVDGTITVSGAANSSMDLADEDPPVAGSSPAGTLGSITFTQGASSGLYTLFSAALTLPIDVHATVMFGDPGQERTADLDLEGSVKANASFYAALSGVPGDFDNDADVDAADLPLWQAGFGKLTGATRGDGDTNGDGAVDGGDFLVWQANRGLAPPPLPGVSLASEPSSACLWLCGMLVAKCLRPRKPNHAS